MKNLIMIFTLAFALAACGQPYGSRTSDEIAALSDSWEMALNAGDTDALVSLYATDAVLMPPNASLERGQEAIRTMFGGMVAGGLTLELTTLEAQASGDTGHNVGVYTMRAKDGGTIDVGKFVEIWKKTGGNWHIAYDIWNSDMPAAKEGGAESHLMILHEVEDPARWLAAWRGENSRHKLFSEHGAAHVHTFQNPDKPELMGLAISVTDMAALQAMLSSKEGKAAAAEDGVKGDTMTILKEVR